MAKDERLLPIPNIGKEIQLPMQEYPSAYTPIYDDELFSEKRSIREYFAVVYKRLWLILTIVTLATAVSALYMYRLPSIYDATTTLLITPPKQKATAKDSININFGNDTNYYNTQLRLLQNPELMREVVIRLGLHREENLFKNNNASLMGTIRSILSGGKATEKKEETLPTISDSANTEQQIPEFNEIPLTAEESQRATQYAGILLGGINVAPVETTNLVNLKITNTNPEIVAQVADMTAKVFIERDVKRETQGTQKTYDDLTKSIDELKGTIAQLEQDRLNYMKDSNLPLLQNGQQLIADRLQGKSAAWLAAENKRRELENEYQAAVRAVQNGGAGSVPRLSENQGYQQSQQIQRNRQADMDRRRAELSKPLQDMDNKVNELEQKLEALRVKYTDDWWENKAAIDQIAKIKKQREVVAKSIEDTINRESNQIQKDSKNLEKTTVNETLRSLQARLEEAKRTEAQLRESYFGESQQANNQGQAQTRLTTLTNEIETNRNLYNTYIQRQKEIELAINTGRPDNISIQSPAVKPSVPIGPQRNRNIILAFLVSLVASIGLAFLLDYLDDSIKTPDDIGRSLGLPTLAIIPHQNSIQKGVTGLLNAKNDSSTSTALAVLDDNRSPIAEAYRHLRTSLLFSSAGKPPQTMLITSAQPSEGKTTTAINTAITLAQAGADVAIIDCDLRRPRLHQHFNFSNTHGITNYLSGDKNVENLLKPLPQLPNLKIITSGPIPPNPAELITSNEMRTLIEFLKSNFKHVIIDSPPAISFTDAAILSTFVDGVIIVAMSGKSSTSLIKRFKQRLYSLGVRVYGVVLNGVKPNALEYGYYGYGYSYEYYYSHNEDDEQHITNS